MEMMEIYVIFGIDYSVWSVECVAVNKVLCINCLPTLCRVKYDHYNLSESIKVFICFVCGQKCSDCIGYVTSVWMIDFLLCL